MRWTGPVEGTGSCPLRSLHGKVALVTRTSGGRGAGAAELFAAAGARRFNPVEDVRRDEWDLVLIGSTAGVAGSMSNERIAHTVTAGGIVALTKQLPPGALPTGSR